jgi:hypothetical protein
LDLDLLIADLRAVSLRNLWKLMERDEPLWNLLQITVKTASSGIRS